MTKKRESSYAVKQKLGLVPFRYSAEVRRCIKLVKENKMAEYRAATSEFWKNLGMKG